MKNSVKITYKGEKGALIVEFFENIYNIDIEEDWLIIKQDNKSNKIITSIKLSQIIIIKYYIPKGEENEFQS